MTLEQQTIYGDERTLVDGRQLTERQQAAWDLVRRSAYGVETDEVGAHLHAARGKHVEENRCTWCSKDGLHVLRSKALAGLVTRRRSTGRWYCRNRDDELSDQQTPADGQPSAAGDEYDPATSSWPEGF